MEDMALRQSIVDALDLDPLTRTATVGVAVEKGIVSLFGHVGTFAQKVCVETLVRSFAQARAIAVNIEVRRVEDKKTHDDEIAARAVAIIARQAMIREGAIRVKVEGGWVTLTGRVSWPFQRDQAVAATRKLSGVVGVLDGLDVMDDVQQADVTPAIGPAPDRPSETRANPASSGHARPLRPHRAYRRFGHGRPGAT